MALYIGRHRCIQDVSEGFDRSNFLKLLPQVDTNFINFSIQNKLDIWQSMMDCLYAKCIPYISDCVMAEIEKLGPKFKVALRIAKDSR